MNAHDTPEPRANCITDPEAEAMWDEIAAERERELALGIVEAIPAEVVIARLQARFANGAPDPSVEDTD